MSWVAVGITTAAVSAGSSIYGGMQAQKSAKAQAALMEQQGETQKEEALREADRIRDDGFRFQQEQGMAYLSSGVELVGTPLLVMAETIKMSENEALATEKRGYAQSDLANAQAKITKAEGKAQMISGILGAPGKAVQSYGSVMGLA